MTKSSVFSKKSTHENLLREYRYKEHIVPAVELTRENSKEVRELINNAYSMGIVNKKFFTDDGHPLYHHSMTEHSIVFTYELAPHGMYPLLNVGDWLYIVTDEGDSLNGRRDTLFEVWKKTDEQTVPWFK